MLRLRRRSLPLLFALTCAACNTKSDEELRAMMGDVASNHVGDLQDSQKELAAAQQELATELATLSQTVTALEQKVASAEARIAELEAEPVAPPSPAAPPLAGRPDPAATYKVPLDDTRTKGPDTALVTVVIWSDFQCPFCARVTPTLEQIEKDYGEKVRFAFKHNPLAFHARALPAAIAAEAAGEQGKFWEMHDKLFANQRDLTDTNFETWAKELKLDVKAFKAAVKDSAIERRIKSQQTEGNALGARGTPAFFINGRFLSGAQPLESFKTLIDAELKKAEALVAGGTSPDRVYGEIIATGKTGV